jgi:hypothetical protein
MHDRDVIEAKLECIATRDQLHKLVDELPETDLDPVAEILISRRENGGVGDAAQPGDVIDGWGNLSAMRRASTARKMRRLDEAAAAAGHDPW